MALGSALDGLGLQELLEPETAHLPAVARLPVPAEGREQAHGLAITALLRGAYTRERAGSRVAALVDALLTASPEFAGFWHRNPVAGPYCEPKRIRHPRLGLLELHGQNLLDPGRSQTLVIFTADPGSESHEKLRTLSASRWSVS